MVRKSNGGNRIIDTFAARDLSAYEKKPTIYSFVEVGVRTGEDLSMLRRRRKRMEHLTAR